jgi:endonuclease YncB( thermonuclease family)
MTGRVVWVVDGDTIHVRVGPRLEKVRYIGVNAQVMTIPPNVKYQGLLLALQREARESGRGLWGEG